MRTTEKIGWLLIGAAIGAGVALLYAPKSGKETRKYLRKKAENARDSIVETGEQIYEAGRDVYSKGADMVTEAADSAADLFQRGRKVFGA